MGEDVQHPRPPRQPRGECVVRALIEEKPGLLPAQHVGHIGGAVHLDRHRPVNAAAQNHGFLGQAFKPARPTGAVLDHRLHPGHRDQYGGQIVDQRLGPGGVRLHHRDIAETVDDDARQAVSLGMDKAVEGPVEQPRAQIKRSGKPRRQPVAVDHRLGVAIQHPRDDLRARVHRDRAQHPALGIFQRRDHAGRQPLRAPVGHQLVGIDPGKAVPDRAGLGLGAQPHDGTGLRRFFFGHGGPVC